MKKIDRLLTVFVGLVVVAGLLMGAYRVGSLVAASAGTITFGSRSILSSPADDKLKWTNAAGTSGTVLDHTANGAVSAFALDGTTAATWTFQHVAGTTVTASGAVTGGSLVTTGAGSVGTFAITSPTTVEYLLDSTAAVDVGAVAEYQLFTVPSGKTAVVTKIVIRSCSASLNQDTDAVCKFGFNAGTHDDVLGAKTLTAPTAATGYMILQPTAENSTGNVQSTMGAAAAEFAVNCTTAATASTTCVVDTWGYYF